MGKSLEEISKLPPFKYGDQVICKVGESYSFIGKIAGLANE